ncbi:NADPH-dependent 2,4-dienoyl-CoA reductase, sulfur reductase [Carboxydocella sporoproducens DSM 16521]|uniref:NADPH-dependent 2,4-dienoyl-CoA reductase, sulfur reductase n=2 Tax=Carboxydocella TaxID=178898 RepID=A0A1T4QU41_9FIRM|nr:MULTISPECIES: CoA-disulfide reductase [Carboxydocella]AVX21648.1 NADPH-dependent 2,4-dienoyl-CoA reductase, sulfur reductase [Carboxydocella thermautotrophica]SKA07282.1 NADPH-dependent 2,4-dienoyl-CoA reductase, sulfur reductase [Carboxydocella sporoproducens DSM 16521]
MKKRIVILGGVAAGMSAAAKARRTDSDAIIEVYTSEEFISYGACGLPYFLSGVIPSYEKLIARTPPFFAQQNIQVFLNHKGLAINSQELTLQVLDHESNLEKKVSFDALVIATGARPIIPPLPGIKAANIFTLKTIPDALRIKDYIRRFQPRNAVIVGGGYIGLEVAEAFIQLGLKTTIIELAPQVAPNLDADLAQLIEQELLQHGVEVKTGHKVLAFEGEERVTRVITDQGPLPADLVLLAIGVTPNSEIAETAGIKLGPKQAILTDNQQRTNLPYIFAAGDCATVYHRLYQGPAYIPLGTTANKQGRVAGNNAAGGQLQFDGVLGTGIAKILNLEVARTGLSTREATQLNLNFNTTVIKSRTRAAYYPESTPITIKLLWQEENRRLIGGQIVGGPGSGKRIDVIATAISAGMSVDEFRQLDLAYAPPFAPVWDPLLIAANQAD